MNIFLFICTPLYIIDEIEERDKVETLAKNNIKMWKLEKEQVVDLFVAVTKKKQFYVFSEENVNRGSLFISADVEKFIIRFSSLGFLPFCTIGFDERSSFIYIFIYRAQRYKRLVYPPFSIFEGLQFSRVLEKEISFEIVKGFDFRVRMFVSSFFLISRAKRAGRERLDVVLTGETWKERKKRRKKRSLISKARVWLAQREIQNSFSEYRACSLTRLPGRFSNCSAV